nr:hypothetical protein GCM10020063_039660 [Dactylosporangium thailandense]
MSDGYTRCGRAMRAAKTCAGPRAPHRIPHPDKEADNVLLDATAPNGTPLNSASGAVVSLMDRTNVETVIVAGKVRKRRGKLPDADLDSLRRELENSRDYLFRATGIRRDLFAYS